MTVTRRALPAVLLLLLLAGCGASDLDADPVPSDSPTPSTVATPSQDATPTADPTPMATATGDAATQTTVRDLAEFQTDSVQCVVWEGVVECQLLGPTTYEVPAKLLEYGPPCTVVSLRSTETEGKLGCPGDMLSETVLTSEMLPVGTVVSHGGFTCTLLEVGARCSNEVGGEVEIRADAYRLSRDA
ncbi:hypothetical protein ACTHAM_001666 [Cellulomonas soli]|uniref:hypothetical protein n=1 Tax=Cellulomonas soli TaxID=931535 RepID=UPI003F863D91